jgi:hypothetical protein
MTTTLLELTSDGACKERAELLLSSKAAQGARQNAFYRFYSGQDALTFAHDSLFPSVIFKTCKASPMPHIQQDRNICS